VGPISIYLPIPIPIYYTVIRIYNNNSNRPLGPRIAQSLQTRCGERSLRLRSLELEVLGGTSCCVWLFLLPVCRICTCRFVSITVSCELLCGIFLSERVIIIYNIKKHNTTRR